MKKVLITANCHPHLINYLNNKNFQVDYFPQITYAEVEHIISEYVGIVVTTRIKVDKILLDKTNNLKWIARLGSGMELIDTDYAIKKNIICVSSPEGNSQAVAEHCLAMLLCLIRNINKSVAEVKQQLWQREENRGEELQTKNIGIIGYGNTGAAFAKLIYAFQPNQIFIYDKYKNAPENDIQQNVSLKNLLSYSDIVSIHLPLNKDTLHLANQSFFNQMKNDAYFINTSRGEIVHTKDLIVHLDQNNFKGVLLDVLENEKINQLKGYEKQDFQKLISFRQVLITPHIAGYTKEAFFKMADVVIQKLDQLIN